MEPGTVVKYSQPMNPAEESARFILTENNGDRGFIRLICALPIAPVELVRMSDVVEA